MYVETPALHRLPEKQRRAILSALRLAQELGAETATLSDPAEDKAVIHYAREHNLGKIVLGRPTTRRWWRSDSFADKLAHRAPDLDLMIVALDEPLHALCCKRLIVAPLRINGGYKFRVVWLPLRCAPSLR